MLFQQLYNLIKYKTLPASFLFKNRLFIERDSKHKRILTNFGLIFRNSKWSQYESYNIKQVFYSYFFKIIKYFLLLLCIFLYFYNYQVSFFYIFNFFSLIFWLSLEILELYFIFFIWLISSFFINFLNFFFSFFVNNFFIKVNNPFSQNKSSNLKSFKNTFFSKESLNWQIYYSISNLSNKTIKSSFINSLFSFESNKKFWNLNYPFFHTLFRLNYLLNKNNTIDNFFLINNTLDKKLNNDFTNFFFSKKYITHSFWFLLNNTDSFYGITYKNKKRFIWNLKNIFIQNNENYSLISLKNNIFFINKKNLLNNFFFNKELVLIFHNITKTSLISSKWDRWLYKYSLISRKFIKNSYKNTLTKSMLNNGNFYSNFSEKNIWNSEYFSKINFKDNFFFFFTNANKKNNDNLFYKNIINLNFNIKNINNLENSYFWFINKFFSFNSNTSNKIKSIAIRKFDNASTFSFFYKNIFINIEDSLRTYSFQLNNFFFKENLELYKTSNFKNHFLFKNSVPSYYLILNNNNFLSEENISFLISILNSNLNTHKNYNYLNYNKKTFINKNKKFFFISNGTNKNDNFSLIFIKSNLYKLNELNLNKDLFFTSLFNK